LDFKASCGKDIHAPNGHHDGKEHNRDPAECQIEIIPFPIFLKEGNLRTERGGLGRKKIVELPGNPLSLSIQMPVKEK
jgi:hypothetical protein